MAKSKDDALAEKFKELHEKVQSHELMRPTNRQSLTQMLSLQQKGLGTSMVTMDHVEWGIALSRSVLERHRSNEDAEEETATSAENTGQPMRPYSKRLDKRPVPYIKITLRISDEMVFYEQRSMTALADSEEGCQVRGDNERYEYLLLGKDKTRRQSHAETQTSALLLKSRDVNTETIKKDHQGAYVSNFDMYDTYKFLEQTTESVEIQGQQKIEVTTYKVRGVDEFVSISQSHSFHSALMVTLRILAGNVYELEQRRFRNMLKPDPLAERVQYLYRLQLLWRNIPAAPLLDANAKAVADLSFCPGDGDIYAVAYGIYSYPVEQLGVPSEGCVCVWNIKNPVNAERCYHYSTPVVTVEFSPYTPQLLALGLYDGIVEVRDISSIALGQDSRPVAMSQRTNNNVSCEPVVAIKWLSQSAMGVGECIGGAASADAFLALSRDGVVCKYRLINSPTLLMFPLLRLERVEGTPEGLAIQRPFGPVLATQPQALNLCLDPVAADIYYVLTDEGCIHKCSTNYPQQHLEVRQVVQHVACNTMEFSPWSPKLYLTCGNDWSLRIWLDGMLKPLITLQHGIAGPVHTASWSPTHSTVIVAICHKTVLVWDISRQLKPVSINQVDTSSIYTLFKFSKCGRSLAAGNQQGEILMLAMEDLPFAPHFQYEKLQRAIFSALASDAQLLKDVKSLGHFGY